MRIAVMGSGGIGGYLVLGSPRPAKMSSSSHAGLTLKRCSKMACGWRARSAKFSCAK
jgi:hypothetical protein